MKNVILILTDQQRWDTIGANGGPRPGTPNIDRLAAEGLNFTNHFVTSTVCSPSRGSIWTGMYPSENGLYANGCSLPHGTRTIPAVLRDKGFTTAHIGKLHLEAAMSRGLAPHAYGFETLRLAEGDQWLTHDDYNLWLRNNHPHAFFEFHHQMALEGHSTAYVSNLPEELTMSRWVASEATTWLEHQAPRDQPFFLSLGFFDPHHAWNPSEPYASRWAAREVSLPETDPHELETKPPPWHESHKLDAFALSSIIRAYHAMIEHVDDCIGSVLSALERTGRARDTVVIFTSDHGEFLGRHGKLFKGPLLCDDLLRVPLVIWDGAARAGGRRLSAPTSSLDLFSTVLSLAGLQEIPVSRGRPLLDHDFAPHPKGERDHVISEWRSHPTDSGWLGDVLSVRTSRERYVRYANTGGEEYYDHATDPAEACNLADRPETAARRETLAQILATEAPSPGSWPPPSAPW